MQLHQVEATRICFIDEGLEGRIRLDCHILPHVEFPHGEDL